MVVLVVLGVTERDWLLVTISGIFGLLFGLQIREIRARRDPWWTRAWADPKP